MAKKSAAQIKRMIKRAEARGEQYEPPIPPTPTPTSAQPPKVTTTTDDDPATAHDQNVVESNGEDARKVKVAQELERALQQIEAGKGTALKAKERRSAKRKAEAIASEALAEMNENNDNNDDKGGDGTSVTSAAELLEWYQAYQQAQTAKMAAATNTAAASDSTTGKAKKKRKGNVDAEKTSQQHHNNPYIAFIGQLSFDTTVDSLRNHIREALGEEFTIDEQTVQIRLLTNRHTKKSRGMAFVQVDNPELLYALLRLHQTHLEGRRINIERSAGGKAQSFNKKQKLDHFRQEQQEYFSSVVDDMLQDFYQQGTIAAHGELDDGVIALLKRHSTAVVQAALERYVETDGKTKDNPNAYLSFLVGKMAQEGIIDFEKKEQGEDPEKSGNNHNHHNHKKRPHTERDKSHEQQSSHKRPARHDKGENATGTSTSVLEKEGVHMNAIGASSSAGRRQQDMSKIFPSFNRGRGRQSKV